MKATIPSPCGGGLGRGTVRDGEHMESFSAVRRVRGRQVGRVDSPCHTCLGRTWRSVHGFMVMGCGPKGLRFGIAEDIRRGHVNKAGGCVEMPRECDAEPKFGG